MSKVENARSDFEAGFSCSQSVLAAYGPQLGLDREMALRVAGAFGGGIGHLGRTCGAVTGSFMVIGLRYGKTKAKDDETKEKTYRLVGKFVEEFSARNGSTICRELLGSDIGTPEGMRLAEERGLFTSLCPKLVQDAAEILERLLELE